MKRNILILCALITNLLFAQYDSCHINKSKYSNLYAVTSWELSCIARQADKDICLFYTFASWCSSSRVHFPAIIELTKKYNLDCYIIVPERENDITEMKQTTDYLDKLLWGRYKGLIVSDSLYRLNSSNKCNRINIQIT